MADIDESYKSNDLLSVVHTSAIIIFDFKFQNESVNHFGANYRKIVKLLYFQSVYQNEKMKKFWYIRFE